MHARILYKDQGAAIIRFVSHEAIDGFIVFGQCKSWVTYTRTSTKGPIKSLNNASEVWINMDDIESIVIHSDEECEKAKEQVKEQRSVIRKKFRKAFEHLRDTDKEEEK